MFLVLPCLLGCTKCKRFFNFRFNDDVVTIIVRKNSSKQQHQNDRMHGLDEYDTKTPTFCMQLQMSYTKKRRTPQLEWKKYSVKID